jgi:hypothetical protein
VKEAREYAGAHVLSMVHAHYPLIDFKHFKLGYPKEVGPNNGRHQLVRDIVIAGARASIFKSATESCGLDQPVPGAKNFVRRVTGGYGLDQPDPGGTSFLSQRGTATIER